MKGNPRGQVTLEVLGFGTGLPVIFEEVDDDGCENGNWERAGMECWRCDSCEECLRMALKEEHPGWKRYGKRVHTCCPSRIRRR